MYSPRRLYVANQFYLPDHSVLTVSSLPSIRRSSQNTSGLSSNPPTSSCLVNSKRPYSRPPIFIKNSNTKNWSIAYKNNTPRNSQHLNLTKNYAGYRTSVPSTSNSNSKIGPLRRTFHHSKLRLSSCSLKKVCPTFFLLASCISLLIVIK